MLSKAKVKYIQSLGHKKLRDELRLFIAEGPKVVEEFIRGEKFDCRVLCGTKDWLEQHPSLVRKAGEVLETELFELEKISLLSTPHAVLGVFSQAEPTSYSLSGKLSLVLDGIRDPGNMGTIIRTADWFGIENILCSEDCVDCYNPKVVQATMGSLGVVNVVYGNSLDIISAHPAISVYAATLGGEDVASVSKVDEGFIIIGNEGSGIREGLMSMVKKEITIPRLGRAESLNAAVACGIILAVLRRESAS